MHDSDFHDIFSTIISYSEKNSVNFFQEKVKKSWNFIIIICLVKTKSKN